MRRFLLWIVALVAFCVGARCEEVSFEVNVPRAVAVGQPFGVEFSINAKYKDFVAPSFEGFSVLAGPSTSTSTSVQLINGKMSQSVNHTISYVLTCSTEGEFTIGAASVVADGKSYQTRPVVVKVIKESGSGSSSAQGQGGGQQGQQSPTATLAEDDVLIVASVDRTRAYKGEPVLVTYKLYTRVAMNAEGQKMPSFAGFWTQRLNVDGNRWVREEYGGKLYDACPVAEYLLFPQQSGELKIEPLEMSIVARLQVKAPRRGGFDPFSDFFDVPQIQEVRRVVKSKEITLNVRPLPEGAPASFSGAVGEFELNVTPPADEIEANSAVTYVAKISGTGNLPMIQAPQLKLPSSFEQYSVKSTESIQTTSRGVSGYRQFEYPMIARAEGDYFIPPMEFSFFNPRLGKYVTLTAKEYALHITPDSHTSAAGPNPALVGGIDKEAIKFLGTDIRFIDLAPTSFRPAGKVFLFSGGYFLVVVVIIMTFVALAVVLRKRLREMRNQATLKGKRANKVALARFRAAERYMKEANQRGFYEEMLRGLWGYLGDKLNIPAANLTKENIREQLARKGVEAERVESYVALITDCEYAQYAPSGSGHMEEAYLKGVELISRLEGEINR